jgi:RimJ/RimL family protein N-acetyltransferase
MTGSVTTNITAMEAEFWIMRNLSRQERGLAHIYVIEQNAEQGSGKAIGMIDLFKRSEDSALEIGYSLMPDFWGQGFMFEACEAVIGEARRTLGAARIIAGVFIDNPASLRLLHKLGFTSARTHEEWFSMGRMEKAKGVTLTLEMPPLEAKANVFSAEDKGQPFPSPETGKSAISHRSHDLPARDKIAIRA